MKDKQLRLTYTALRTRSFQLQGHGGQELTSALCQEHIIVTMRSENSWHFRLLLCRTTLRPCLQGHCVSPRSGAELDIAVDLPHFKAWTHKSWCTSVMINHHRRRKSLLNKKGPLTYSWHSNMSAVLRTRKPITFLVVLGRPRTKRTAPTSCSFDTLSCGASCMCRALCLHSNFTCPSTLCIRFRTLFCRRSGVPPKKYCTRQCQRFQLHVANRYKKNAVVNRTQL